MYQNTPNPQYLGLVDKVDWLIAAEKFLETRINALTQTILSNGSGGGGVIPTLTATYIGYGDSSNQLTGSSDFTYDNTNNFIIGFLGTEMFHVRLSSSSIMYHANIYTYTSSSGELDINLTNLTDVRTRVEPDKDGTYAMLSDIADALPAIGGTITIPAYGTTVDLSAVVMTAGEIRDIEFASSTGASGVLFPTTTNAAVGAMIIVSDLLAISPTSNITVNAGMGNTLNSEVIAQTKVMNVSGSCWIFKKVSATQWKLQ